MNQNYTLPLHLTQGAIDFVLRNCTDYEYKNRVKILREGKQSGELVGNFEVPEV